MFGFWFYDGCCLISPIVEAKTRLLLFLLDLTIYAFWPSRLQTMVSFRSALLSCLLATTSYAFAVQPITQTPAFSRRSNAGATRVPVNLSMSGGAQTVPDLKVSFNTEEPYYRYFTYLTLVCRHQRPFTMGQ